MFICSIYLNCWQDFFHQEDCMKIHLICEEVSYRIIFSHEFWPVRRMNAFLWTLSFAALRSISSLADPQVDNKPKLKSELKSPTWVQSSSGFHLIFSCFAIPFSIFLPIFSIITDIGILTPIPHPPRSRLWSWRHWWRHVPAFRQGFFSTGVACQNLVQYVKRVFLCDCVV